MDKCRKKAKVTTTEKLILVAFLRSCSYCFAFVLFLAKNIKIVPYDEKKHGGTSEIGGYIESDPRKFDYIFGAIRDH